MSTSTSEPGERLAGAMAAAWRRGERPPAEHFLNAHPGLFDDSEAAVRVVYEEACLRLERGEEVAADEYARRFPRWAGEIAVMLECHGLVRDHWGTPLFPEVGETLGDFHLTAELGRGAAGRVYLATQPALADRPVVLKVTRRTGREFLSLARLQHTHVIPLYGVYDFPARNLRGLCQPYFGGATLAQLLDRLGPEPARYRSGAMLVAALGEGGPPRGPRAALAKAAYPEAVAWVGACVADALHFAHERGVVHLDIKPANVLIAADGQPLLLDFHLAVPPVAAGGPAPPELGGSPGYMSPEQAGAYQAALAGRPLPAGVDHRSDIYSLGRLLTVALGGRAPDDPTPLRDLNPNVSVGLADIVARCLAANPADRYADAAAVADDLRRHLADQPLAGVRNRSLPERWRKWHRRRPHALLWAGLALALAAAPAVVTHVAVNRTAAVAPADDSTAAAYRANFDVGANALRAGRPADAAFAFGAAVAVAPDRAEAYYNRALAREALGDGNGAGDDYDRALALAPGMAQAWLNRGAWHYRAGRHAAARSDLERALAAGATPAAAHYNLALVAVALGDRAAAREHVEAALRHDPAHPDSVALRVRMARP